LEKNPAADLRHPAAEVVTAVLGMTAHLLSAFLILESRAVKIFMTVIILPLSRDITAKRCIS
jgi:hypothetical protein